MTKILSTRLKIKIYLNFKICAMNNGSFKTHNDLYIPPVPLLLLVLRVKLKTSHITAEYSVIEQIISISFIFLHISTHALHILILLRVSGYFPLYFISTILLTCLFFVLYKCYILIHSKCIFITRGDKYSDYCYPICQHFRNCFLSR